MITKGTIAVLIPFKSMDTARSCAESINEMGYIAETVRFVHDTGIVEE
ncbi:MAG: hypothetical protein ACT6FG_05630 [Methanosarcinaceae archaeon]